ncbi:MAG: hypothetical protein GX568_01820, partial [Candidatus Gastranaerophilales bacterium]|nr:hypothetical protein [Candidatus Gastranaerophilales bacterium]
LQTTPAKPPVRLLFKHDFVSEGEKFDSIIENLIQAGTFMDVDEPLNRVKKTLDLICEQKL